MENIFVLFQRAKEIYPKGTVFKSASKGEVVISDGCFYISDNRILCVSGVAIRKDEKWAEIMDYIGSNEEIKHNMNVIDNLLNN